MSIQSYLKDKALPLFVWLFFVLGTTLVLYVFALDSGAIGFVCVLLVVGMLLALALDYLRRCNFYATVACTLEQLDDAYLIVELLDRPGFAEGDALYDALAQATKAMNDKIGEYRFASEEYRDYVETWIHEVKTPIAAAHLIAENHSDSIIESMNDEVSRIEGYVEQALFYSRSATVEKDFSIKQENLGSLVREALRRNARTLIAAGLTPKLDDLDVVVLADAKWIVFILGQILGNAAKYRKPMHGEGQREELLVSMEQKDIGLSSVYVVLTISDRGIGIPASDVPRVFDKGFTGENGRAFAKSTGIGLYLCRQLCTKMGLEISLVSTQGEGTCVSVSFPQNRMYFIDEKIS